jgi:hypothetical protein
LPAKPRPSDINVFVEALQLLKSELSDSGELALEL